MDKYSDLFLIFKSKKKIIVTSTSRKMKQMWFFSTSQLNRAMHSVHYIHSKYKEFLKDRKKAEWLEVSRSKSVLKKSEVLRK